MSGACEWFELVQYVESFDMGINFLVGPPGPPGPAGEAIFIPHVSEDGVLSWTNTAGLPNPDPIDLSGPAGTTDYSDLTNKPSINGVTLSGNKTAEDLGLVEAIGVASAFAIPSSGASVSYNLAGITAEHELVRWNFSTSAENEPPADLRWTTYAGYFTITNNGGTTSESMRPVFAVPTKKAATIR